MVVTQHFPEHLGEVKVPAAGHAVVHFLQSDDIGFFGFADTRDAFWTKLAVIADCLMDVICQDSNQQGRNLLHGQG
ncbi:MAG: hypothetical protein OHK0011_15690 [Turneriella sp.]